MIPDPRHPDRSSRQWIGWLALYKAVTSPRIMHPIDRQRNLDRISRSEYHKRKKATKK